MRAEDLFKQASDAGDVDATRDLAADGGEEYAAKNLALVLQDGADGVPKDAGRAARLYRQVVDENDDTEAMVSLAELLQNGDEGLERDAVQAVMLYRQAIDGGHTSAQDLLDEFLDGERSGIMENLTRVTRLCRISKIEGPLCRLFVVENNFRFREIAVSGVVTCGLWFPVCCCAVTCQDSGRGYRWRCCAAPDRDPNRPALHRERLMFICERPACAR